jgi:hypothetical protein
MLNKMKIIAAVIAFAAVATMGYTRIMVPEAWASFDSTIYSVAAFPQQ